MESGCVRTTPTGMSPIPAGRMASIMESSGRYCSDTRRRSTTGQLRVANSAGEPLNDDVITSAGYRIGPFDVESCLIEHPAVAESAVVGKPDPERTELVKAFVVLRPGYEPQGD